VNEEAAPRGGIGGDSQEMAEKDDISGAQVLNEKTGKIRSHVAGLNVHANGPERSRSGHKQDKRAQLGSKERSRYQKKSVSGALGKGKKEKGNGMICAHEDPKNSQKGGGFREESEEKGDSGKAVGNKDGDTLGKDPREKNAQ